MPGDEPIERLVDVAQLLVGVTRLFQFVAARVRECGDSISYRWIGVITQPVGSLHDVRIGVVHDQARGVVRHHISVASRTAAGIGCVVRTTAVRPITTAPSTTTMVTSAAIDRCSPNRGHPQTIERAGCASWT